MLEAWDRDTIRRLLPDADVAFTPFVDRDIFPSLDAAAVDSVARRRRRPASYPEMLAEPGDPDERARHPRAARLRSMCSASASRSRASFTSRSAHQSKHEWTQDQLEGSGMSAIRQLRGARMGVVGLGAIGLEVAHVASAFGLRVSAIRRHDRWSSCRRRRRGARHPSDLPLLLAKSDVLVLCAALTRRDARPDRRARDRADEARRAARERRPRPLIVDDAVVEGLSSGQLGGAALDVFTPEPLDPSSPYWDLPNVIITPHTSGAMADYYTPLVALFSANLRRYERGQPLLNLVDKQAGY